MGYQIVAVLEDIRRNLYLFLFDRMSVSDFTNWLHSRSDLESIIGVDLVNQLCNLDFSEPVNVAPVLEHLADIFTKKWPGYLESLEPCIEQIEIFLASKRPYPECVDYFYLVQIEYIKYGTRGPELPDKNQIKDCVAECENWGIYATAHPLTEQPGIIALPDSMATLFRIAISYPPSIALCRGFENETLNSSQFLVETSYRVLRILERRSTLPYLMAKSLKNEIGYRLKGEYYWLIGSDPSCRVVSFVSHDFEFYSAIADEFEAEKERVRDLYSSGWNIEPMITNRMKMKLRLADGDKSR